MVRKSAGMVLAGMLGLMVASPVTAKTWVKADSPHFTVFTDMGPKIAAAYALRLEQYRYILGGFYGVSKEDDDTTPRLRVYFVDTRNDLQQIWPHVPDSVAGYYTGCEEGEGAVGLYEEGVIRQTTDVKAQLENPSQAVLFHEYAHDFMFQHSSVPYPPWFVEGFAEFYSTTKIQGDEAIIGMSFSWRATSLMYSSWTVKYEDLLRDTWRPKKGDPDPGLTDAFYSESWLLTHYILSDPERHSHLEAFLQGYRAGKDPVAAFEAAFGIKVKDLDHLLARYFNDMKATVYRIKDMPAPQVTTAALPASAEKLLLWDAADRMCPSTANRPLILSEIRAEAAKYPDDDYAKDVLARAEIVIGDEWKALDYLKARVATHPDDAEANFMLGQTWYLMTIHKHIIDGETRDSQLTQARAALGHAYQLDPLNAPNLYYYSRALARPGEPPSDNMITAAMEAQALAPAVQGYAVNAANMLIARNRLPEAKMMLVPLASNPHDPRGSAWAKAIIAVIDGGGTKEEAEKAMKAPVGGEGAAPPPPPGPKDGSGAAPAK